eukprot:2743094-Prorocentrum_lima.AAC.1
MTQGVKPPNELPSWPVGQPLQLQITVVSRPLLFYTAPTPVRLAQLSAEGGLAPWRTCEWVEALHEQPPASSDYSTLS